MKRAEMEFDTFRKFCKLRLYNERDDYCTHHEQWNYANKVPCDVEKCPVWEYLKKVERRSA